jgi:putative FmdB family regulatory protein
MPIYEFYCAACHTVYHFLSRTVAPRRTPSCPHCGRPDLERRVSSFAISKGRPEPAADGEPGGVDEARLERAMESLAREGAGLDDEDPKAAARFMRRLYETAGIPLQSGFEEALRRLEAGEDPEAIETELGDVLGADPMEGATVTPAAALRRRLTPARVDPELHEL